MGKYRDNAEQEDEIAEQADPRAEESGTADGNSERPGSDEAVSGDVQDSGPEGSTAQNSTGSNEPSNADQEAARLRKCQDHPKRFPDEDQMRLLTEFPANGRYPRSYCRRCQVLRQKDYLQARREQHKVPSEPAPDETSAETGEDDKTDSSD